MSKQQLQEKLIDFQRHILNLSQELRSQQQEFQDSEQAFLLELMRVLDAFENIFHTLAEKEATFEKSVRRGLKSFHGIQRQILRILQQRGVEKIELLDGKAVIGLCQVVETRSVDGLEEGEIIAIVRNGYRRGERVLRPVEVITATHHTAGA